MEICRSVSPTTTTSTEAQFNKFHVANPSEHSKISTKLFYDILENPKGLNFAQRTIFGATFEPIHVEALKLAQDENYFTVSGTTFNVSDICEFLNTHPVFASIER